MIAVRELGVRLGGHGEAGVDADLRGVGKNLIVGIHRETRFRENVGVNVGVSPLVEYGDFGLMKDI